MKDKTAKVMNFNEQILIKLTRKDAAITLCIIESFSIDNETFLTQEGEEAIQRIKTIVENSLAVKSVKNHKVLNTGEKA